MPYITFDFEQISQTSICFNKIYSDLMFVLRHMFKMEQEIDDTKVFVYANHKIKVVENLNRWHNISKQYGLKINNNKTIILKIRRDQTATNINLEGISLKEVDTLSYLDSIITRSWKIQNERIKKSINFYFLVKDLLKNKDILKINVTFTFIILRGILGITKKDKIRNKVISRTWILMT